MICGFLPAFNIIGEKQKGNLEQLNVTPISKAKVILSKIIPFWILGLVVLSLCFLLAWAVYGLTPKGGYALAYAFAVMYILVVTGMGLVISNYSNTMQQAMFVAYFFILILILLSGLFTSVKSMPFWAQILTYFNPLRYFIESLRYIFLKGGSLSDLFSLNSDLFSFKDGNSLSNSVSLNADSLSNSLSLNSGSLSNSASLNGDSISNSLSLNADSLSNLAHSSGTDSIASDSNAETAVSSDSIFGSSGGFFGAFSGFSIESITDSMLLTNFAALLLFALFFNLWAILSYKKQS